MKTNRRHVHIFLALLASALIFHVRADAAEPIGILEASKQPPIVSRADKRIRVAEGDALYASDTIETTSRAATIRLTDDTVIEMGPESKLHLVETVFVPRTARLQLNIERGIVRVRTGSIGLKNPRGIKISTPRNLIMPSNAVLLFYLLKDEELMAVEWMPEGPTISAYNIKSQELAEIDAEGTLMRTDTTNVMTFERMTDGTAEGASLRP